MTGGRTPDRAGYFYEPTILTDLPDDARIVAEEQLGPALPVVAYRDVEDALEPWINTHTAIAFDQPFAGAKWSGIGAEAGEACLDAYTDVRVLHRAK